MKKIVFLICIILLVACKDTTNSSTSNNSDFDFETVFEKSGGTETATYEQTMEYYQALANTYKAISFEAVGETDSGKPLHLASFNTESVNKSTEEKVTLLINNGIHPGESDGIDATMMLFRDLAEGKIEVPNNVIIYTIPIYNVGGSLNRNTGTRANQNGPKEYGFRGNGRNFDLNRDFVKSDTKNSRSFAQIYHLTNPDVFIDNHVSNGADYQYTLTHLFTQHNKLGGSLGNYLHTTLMPGLEEDLASKKLDITPYVNVWGTTPEAGWSQFMDYPRYSTGYTTLFNSLGMMVETHMLKPYKDRVEQTYELMTSMIKLINNDSKNIQQLRAKQFNEFRNTKEYALDWKVDSTQVTKFNFKGYEGSYIPSEVTGSNRLFYDKSKPFTKEVSYYNHFSPTNVVSVPRAYIIPQNWHSVVDLLKTNNVSMKQLEKDSTMMVSSYKINSFETRRSPYEGHYQHYNTVVSESTLELSFRAGDYVVTTDQDAMRYLIETLEPSAPDSFFNWNYFDTILQQKEHFSPYVFEDEAKMLLENDSELKKAFDEKKASDESFSNNWYAQLNWIYKQSHHYEKAHMQYPIYLLR